MLGRRSDNLSTTRACLSRPGLGCKLPIQRKILSPHAAEAAHTLDVTALPTPACWPRCKTSVWHI